MLGVTLQVRPCPINIGATILPLQELLPPYGPKEFTLSADDIFAILNTR